MEEKMKIVVLGKSITLYKRPETDSVYYYFSHNGKKFKGSTGVKSFNEIRLDEMTIKVVNVIEGRPVKKIVKQPYTLNVAFKSFMKYKTEKGTSARTLYDMNRKGKFLLEFYGKKDVLVLGTSAMYQKYHNWKTSYYKNNPSKRTIIYKRSNGKTVCGRTMQSNGPIAIDDEIKLLIMILKWCQKFGKIPRDIIIDKHDEYKGERDETKVLNKEEYVKIVDYMRKDNQFYCNIVRFVNNTGVRYPGELLPLKWKHIDFDKHTISIVGRKRGSNRGRTRVDTLIPMTNRVSNILNELRERQNIPKEFDDFVFVNDEGKQVKNMVKYWKKTLAKLGIDSEYTMYSLRHLFAIRMIKRPDISLKMISEWMGHSTTAMLERTYAKWIDIDSKVKVALQSEQSREDVLREELLKKLNANTNND